jgi:HK97 family phage prohead protease
VKVERRSSHGAAVRMETREDGKPVIVGYAARYYDPADPGTEYRLWSDVVERIAPGAFDRAIAEDDVRGLFNHRAEFVLGRKAAGTLRLSTDAKGLRYEIDPPDTQVARDLIESLKRGDISGSSFAFLTRADTVERSADGYVVTLRDVELFDVGPVTYPAYTAAESGVRSDAGAAGELSAQAIRNRAGAARDADALALFLAGAALL